MTRYINQIVIYCFYFIFVVEKSKLSDVPRTKIITIFLGIQMKQKDITKGICKVKKNLKIR